MKSRATSAHPENATLAYAPSAPWYRRRWFRRLKNSVILLAGGVALFVLLPNAWFWARVWYWQSRCDAYTLPPSHIVFETAPAAVPTLWAMDPQYRREFRGDASPEPSVATWKPECWDHLAGLLDSHFAMSGHRFSPIVFLHQLTAADGSSALVAVQYEGAIYGEEGILGFQFNVYEVTPAPFSKAPLSGQMLCIPKNNPALQWRNDPQIIRLYAGQTVPGDPSAFQIDGATPPF